MTPLQKQKQLQELINRTVIRCQNELSKTVGQAAKYITGNNMKLPKTKAELKAYNKIFDDLNIKIQSAIENGIVSAENLANGHIDKELIDYIGGRTLSKAAKAKIFNIDALNNQINRASDRKMLSDRVWKITETTREGIQQIVSSDIGQTLLSGKSASKVATQLKQHLANPDKRFKRVRDKNGKLIASNPMSKYHPGQGVYRSSYKNALRLSANEVNMSYRLSENERYNSIEFVTGFEVSISNNHPVPDICDHLAGEYPKDFVFRGWHTLCRCYTKSIMIPDKEFDKYLSGEVDDIKELSKPYMVKELPESAVKYINDKKEVFAGWKNPPYFLKDNEKILRKV